MKLLTFYFKRSFVICLLALSGSSYAQFWTENFNNGCTAACPAPGYTGVNGAWTQTILGPEGTDPNPWFVSCAEQNNGIGNCSSGCSGGGNASLHVSAKIGNAVCPNDCGSAYDAGGLCGSPILPSCPQTNRRVESPTINCSGQTTIFINYSFIHRGTVGSDFSSVWYFDGTTWANIGTVPQSAITASCSGQGTWSAANLVLPPSANNNPNVKIGFSWINNDDGVGNDPSVAIDDVTLTAATSTPVPVISVTLPSPVCQSNTLTATYTSTTALTSFTWSASSPNVVFSPVNSGTTTISFTGPGTYTVSLTGCQAAICGTGTSTIQVLPTPTVNISASPTVVCTPGGSSTLTATGGPSASSYTWSASSGPAIPNGSVTIASPTANTSYTVLTSVPGCTSSAVYTLSVSPVPTLTLNPNSGICSGQSLVLSAGGASSYTWSPAASLSSANGATVTATPATTTTYTVSGSNGSCSNTATVTVSVNASASVTISPNNPTVCSGQTATLTASGGSTYTWTASSGANPPGNPVITISPAATTTYTLLTGSGTCTASAVTTVSVVPNITVTATPATATICSGGTGTGLTASGTTSYTWAPAAGLSSTSGANVTANPTVSTTYTVTGGSAACTASAVVNLSVTTVSTSVTASASNYCIGGTPVTFTASGATSYAWSPGAGLSATSGAIVTATPVVTTVYSVTGTSGLCNSIATVTVTVPQTSTITVVNSGTLICAGNTATLTASGAATYTWLPTLQTTAGITVNPSTTTTYTVGGQTAAGCMAIPAVVTISVSPAISPVAVSSSPTVCLSQTVALSVTPATGGYFYNWAPVSDVQGPNNTAAVIAKPSAAGNITYTVSVTNGVCTAWATVVVDAVLCTPPTATIQTVTNDSICTKGCVTFTAAVAGSQPMTYQWDFPGGTPPTSNLSNPQICYGSKGSYPVSLILTNAYGSFSVTANNFIHVADTPAVFHASRDTTLKVGQTALLSANGTAATYYWSPNVNGSIACPTCSNTVVQPTVTTRYYIEISNSPYCKRRDSVLVKVDFICGDFFVPNAFSPNGDGLNDLINVHGFCVSTYVLQIYNRWGEKVFETSSFSESWDGTYQGKNLDTGVFVYRADGTTIDGKTFNIKGNITLIR